MCKKEKCFKLGIGKSITKGRKIVNHGHITVNGKVLGIPSFQCRLNDVISVRDKAISKNLVMNNLKTNQRNETPYNLKFDNDKLQAVVLDYCDRNDVQLQLDELLVIEYYSRR